MHGVRHSSTLGRSDEEGERMHEDDADETPVELLEALHGVLADARSRLADCITLLEEPDRSVPAQRAATDGAAALTEPGERHVSVRPAAG